MNHKISSGYMDIRLLPLSAQDSEKYRLIRNREDVQQWFETKAQISKEQQEKWYLRYLENPEEIMFSIYAGDIFIGCNSIYHIDNKNRTAEYGRIVIDKLFSGKGYGYQATMAAIEIAGDKLHLDELRLVVYADNVPAIKTYQRCGFSNVQDSFDSEGRKMIRMQRKLFYENKEE